MKKILAVLLSVLMVCTTCITFVGATDDAGGTDEPWISVDGDTVTDQWYGTVVEGSGFDYRIRHDETNLYLDWRTDDTLPESGNIFRFWFRDEADATVYTDFFTIQADSATTYSVAHAKYNTSKTENKGASWTTEKIDSINVDSTVSEGITTFVVTVPLSAFDGLENQNQIDVWASYFLSSGTLHSGKREDGAKEPQNIWNDAEDDTVVLAAPTLNGTFLDSIWQGGWTTVDGDTVGQWQTANSNTVPSFSYDYKASVADGNLYIGVKYNRAPDFNEDSQVAASNIRIWMTKDLMTVTEGKFGNLVDIRYNGTNAFIVARDDDLDRSAMFVADTQTEDSWSVEFAIPLSQLGFADYKQGDYIGLAITGSDPFDEVEEGETAGYGALHSFYGFNYLDRTTTERFYLGTAFPKFSDVAVATNGYAVDYVTADNTTYPTGFGAYTANLTDNVAFNGVAYDDNWYAFYYNSTAEPDKNNAINGIGEIKVDLHSEKTVGGFKANIWQPGADGIGIPEITVYGSVNNVDWLNLGTMTNPEGAIGWAVLNLEYELPVRYIRFDVKITNGSFAMLNEIEVLNYIHGTTFNVDFANQYEVGYQNNEWVYNGGEELANPGDAIYVYTPDKGATLGEAGSPNIAWWDVWVVDFDAENSRYYIKAFYPCSAESKKDVEIPEFGFIIASNGHGSGLIANSLRAAYALDAPVYVYNMNMQTLGVKDTMDFKNENTISVFAPIEGIVIDNFGDRTESATIMTRVEDKTTIGEICEITYGESKDYNYHYLAVVDSNNKVIAINHVLGRDTVPDGDKTDIVVPEGGYMLLCHADSALADSYKAIEVGSEITLYLNNTDLEELAAGKTKTELNNSVFKVTGFDYDTGVTYISDTGVVAPNKALDVLTDGDKVEDATSHANDGIVLFQNKVCATAGTYPTVELVLALEEAMDINTVNLSFYQEYVSMIGLPKDNKVNISYATDPKSFTSLGDYIFEGENVTGKVGVLDVALDLGLTVNAKYIKVSFQYDDGDSKWTEKPVFEWIGLTEFGVSKVERSDLPDGALTIENFAGYAGGQMTIISRVGDKTTAGEISELCSGVTKDYNYFYLAVVDSNNKVTAINHVLGRKGIPSGVKSNVVVPKGGYLLLCNAGCTTADSFKAIKVGDIITLYNVNLGKLAENSKVVTLEKAGFKVTGFDYDTGVTYISDTGVVAPNKALDVLTDGDKVSNAGNWGTFEGAVLFTNKACTNAEVNPTVDLVLNLDEIKSIDKVVLDFYHCYNVMIGLPKDNKVRLSYSNDGITYSDFGEFTFEGTVEENTFGTIEATFDVEDVEAQYIGISFDIGPSGLTTDGKVVWEFVSLTEVGIDETPVVEEPLKLIEGADATIEGDFLLGLTEGMTIEQIKALFEGEVEVSGVGTGATITAGGKTITIVILGDVKGDGKIDAKDYLFIKRAFLGTLDLTDAQMKAACLSEESKLTSKDYLKVKRHVLETYNIFEEK